MLDDRTGRTDQVSFGVRGIPSLGDIGQYDSSTDPLVGGNDNPYPSGYPSKPTMSGEFGQDTNSDYFSNLNYWASGTVHGPGGYDQPSEGLLRGVEFVATWFSYALASPQEGGAVAKPDRPIAYFEMTPEEADGADHRQLRRGLQPDEGRRDGRTSRTTGTSATAARSSRRTTRRSSTRSRRRLLGVTSSSSSRRRDVGPPEKSGLLPSGRADRLLPDVLPGGGSAVGAAAAVERPAGRSVRRALCRRAGRVDRGSPRREARGGRCAVARLARELRAHE